MLDNERADRGLAEVEAGIDAIAAAMDASVDAGCASTGILPGGLKVKRRAPQIAADIRERHEANLSEPLAMMDWINLWAMAVNEENAAGGRVVTAPTNGAAGIIPRSEEHTSELQSLMRNSYAVFCLKKTNNIKDTRLKTNRRNTTLQT